ncbi:flavohemoprotein [Candidatus Brocadia sinica JPN1]|uniref:Flavohemoprotein n=1 Tax=Candidatus Brocadia sinica JPN1 TaxID=1197129 RepID=A0ABQ0JW23_9BACT|nr:hypothetical protein [Candidatus Brocadia sp. AMX1]GAN32905.1 flavohemoprotein [Candidatus Brocadia sinica JPN1]GIK14525.1 MAG: hypothetical protein BroJett002_32320 [Candidatus Brocadia sinica]GJQ16212.1 MAG: hypothetical protein HBSIN01_01710 [Candidatus Brocadia sinica]
MQFLSYGIGIFMLTLICQALFSNQNAEFTENRKNYEQFYKIVDSIEQLSRIQTFFEKIRANNFI